MVFENSAKEVNGWGLSRYRRAKDPSTVVITDEQVGGLPIQSNLVGVFLRRRQVPKLIRGEH
jgi:hypothetical protein